MILVDTSVWLDHLRRTNAALVALLGQGQVLVHPFVIGELALGSLKRRDHFLAALQGLPQTIVATESEVLLFINEQKLHSLGIGYIDAHLMASCCLTPDTILWTSDKRLQSVASRLAISFSPIH